MTGSTTAPKGGRFNGLSVLVTGACGGLGRQIVADFAAEGAALTLADRDAGALEALAATLRAGGARVAVSAGDITLEATAEAMVEAALAAFGALDIAVNNAGIASPFARLAETSAETAERTMAVNLFGLFYSMKAEIRAMTNAGGRPAAIVNMASVAGLVGAPQLSLYAASKHAAIGLTRSAALEYARRGIRINAVCPSFARTAMIDDIAARPGDAAPIGEGDLTRGIPMRRLATPAEVSIAVLFAADPANTFMTGQALGVDGGLTAM